jgi:hypothetical protein
MDKGTSGNALNENRTQRKLSLQMGLGSKEEVPPTFINAGHENSRLKCERQKGIL